MSWWTGGRDDSGQVGQMIVDRWARCHGVQVGEVSWRTGGRGVMADGVGEMTVDRWGRCHGGQVGEVDSVQMGQTSWCTGGGRCHGVQVGQMSWCTGGPDVMVDK